MDDDNVPPEAEAEAEAEAAAAAAAAANDNIARQPDAVPFDLPKDEHPVVVLQGLNGTTIALLDDSSDDDDSTQEMSSSEDAADAITEATVSTPPSASERAPPSIRKLFGSAMEAEAILPLHDSRRQKPNQAATTASSCRDRPPAKLQIFDLADDSTDDDGDKNKNNNENNKNNKNEEEEDSSPANKRSTGSLAYLDADDDDSSPAKRTSFGSTPDGGLKSDETPIKEADGTYRKPENENTPKGYDWNKNRGLWTKKKKSMAETYRGIWTESSMTETQKEEASSSAAAKDTHSKLQQTLDGDLIPTKKIKDTHGHYKRPNGRTPKGYDWDKYRGLWTKPTTVKTSPSAHPKPDPAESTSTARAGGRRKAKGLASVGVRNSLLKQGSAVYAPYPATHEDDPHYWGIVQERWEGLGTQVLYKIKFEDGDVLEQISARNFYRMEEIIALSKTPQFLTKLVILKAPHEYMELWNTAHDGPPPEDAFRNIRTSKRSPKSSAAEKEPDKKKSAAAATEKFLALGLSLNLLHDRKCGSCTQCQERQNCGSCVVCIQDDRGARLRTRVCVQKMCSEISPTDKCQQCKHLPSEWYFYFEDEIHNPDHRGLVLRKENMIKKFKSFETAQKSSGKKMEGYTALDFYRHVGLAAPTTAPTAGTVASDGVSSHAARNPAPHEEANRSWSLEKIHGARCGKCDNCNRRPCGTCDSCVRRNPGEGCLRMMCIKIDDQYKLQKSQFLPEGWTFCFAAYPATYLKYGQIKVDLGGFTIKAASGIRYYAVENAMRGNPKAFASLPNAPEQLYKFLGLHLMPAEIQKLRRPKRAPPEAPLNEPLKRKRPRPRKDDDPPSVIEIGDSSMSSAMEHGARAAVEKDSLGPSVPSVTKQGIREPSAGKESLGPSALYRRRCRACAMCRRNICGSCQSCITNKGRTKRYPEICLRNICTKNSKEEKKQLAHGFPPGWTFYFDSREPNPGLVHEELRGLIVLSPTNDNKFRSAEEALSHCGFGETEIQHCAKTFYKQIGAKLLVSVPQHPLVGCLFFKEWIRVDGSVGGLSGRVTKVQQDFVNFGEERVTVLSEDQTRSMLNESNRGKLHVPALLDFDADYAWDGCLDTGLLFGPPSPRLHSKAPFHTKWISPRSYRKKMVAVEGEIVPGYGELPCLEITHKAYLLRFTVKKSSIENAGFGVFLSVHRLAKSPQIPKEFVLEPGELLDFGVYAPFRTEDYRGDHEHFIKSIIHSYKNEMYSFESRESDSYLDITENMTGELHSIARKHVPPFVNEIPDPENNAASVHARLDPEGALHYLLGHTSKAHGDFCFAANGQEEEIFIDYGDFYENVRLREGYPRKELSQIEKHNVLQKEEREYVNELDTFTAEEIDHCLKVFRPLLSCGRQPSRPVLLRTIAVAILMKRRAAAIYEEFHDVGDDESFCDNGVRTLDLNRLVKHCEQMISDACGAWRSCYGSFSELQKDALQSDLFCNIYPQTPIASISAIEFRELIQNEIAD